MDLLNLGLAKSLKHTRGMAEKWLEGEPITSAMQTLNFGIRNFDDQVSESNPAVAVLATTANLKQRSRANAKHGHGEEVLGRSLENEPKESRLCVVIQ